MTKTSTCIYHFLVLSWYTFLNYYISQEGKDEVKPKILANGARWKYMTLLNLSSSRTGLLGLTSTSQEALGSSCRPFSTGSPAWMMC
ncbi:ADTRP isoform 5 [Pan troglodytes]|uniref:Androgen dependent TFPI regulating protein n=2 Tax=Homininae TaxID=207598 RepID=D6RDG9_HUMAN|nr:androgen dependent TFPI regulating protein [Homo sapiens]KAI4016839.1 androgen dependent TFPI regulating protein [Homo sapiens]PNI62838.1 ADTRP isoform 5 [Pan troglodytes]